MDGDTGRHVLTTAELRQRNLDRKMFCAMPRTRIHVVLDGVQRGYNVGAIIRLCDAMLIERLTVCGTPAGILHKRKVVQAAQGSAKWVPVSEADSAIDTVTEAKQRGYQIVIAELTDNSVAPEKFVPRLPMCLVLGNERLGVSTPIADIAEAAICVPMNGMSNSLNVSTAAAIILYQLRLKMVHQDTQIT